MANWQDPVYEVVKWKGLDNLASDDAKVDPGYFRVFNNFDIDDEGMAHGRIGISELALSGNWHSIYGDGKDIYGVRNGDFVRAYLVGTTWTVSTVLASVGSSRMNYVRVYDRIFFSNRNFAGYIDNGVAYAFPDPRPQRQRMVGGELIEFYNGTLYAVQGEMIFRSIAGNPMEMDLDHNFGVIGGPVTMCHAVKDGLYISAGDRVVFAGGPDIFTNYKRVLDSPAIAGSPLCVEGMPVGGWSKELGRAVFFHTESGAYMGIPGGVVKDVTGGRYGVAGITGGTSAYVWQNGYGQYLFMADLINAEVKLDGILPAITS